MSKRIYYRYNPATDSYERVFPSMKTRLLGLLKYLIFGIIVGGAIFFATYYYLESPSEEILRTENAQLRSRYKVLKKRLDYSEKILDQIQIRDDNFYRVLMQMDPMSRSRRFAGVDNSQRYASLQSLSDGELVSRLSQQIDLLQRRLYAQSLSFDELKSKAASRQDMLAHIPSVLPINVKDYTMSSGYGLRTDPVYGSSKFHEGLDFAADEGTPIFATADGVIEFAGWKGGYGNCVDVNHGYNYMTRYGHMSKILARPGQHVKRGEPIGLVGSTGKSTGPHVHYEVRFKGEAQNPINYYYMDLTPAQYDEMIQLAENAGHAMD